MFLEFNDDHFGIKMESVGPSCQKLAFCPYLGMGVARKRPKTQKIISKPIFFNLGGHNEHI